MKVKQTGSMLTISKRLAVASNQKASWFKCAGQSSSCACVGLLGAHVSSNRHLINVIKHHGSFYASNMEYISEIVAI